MSDHGYPLRQLFNAGRLSFLGRDDVPGSVLEAPLRKSFGEIPGAETLRSQREMRAATRSSRVLALEARGRKVGQDTNAALDTAEHRDALLSQRLDRHWEGTDRRLQELLMECLGEHAKACGRASRRSGYLRASVSSELAAQQETSSWALFLLRLEHESPGTSFVDVNPRVEDFAEATRFCSALVATIVSGTSSISRIIDVKQSGRAPRRQRDNSNILSDVVDESSVGELLRTIARPSCVGSQVCFPDGSPRVPSFDRGLLLSSRPLLWRLLPGWMYTGRRIGDSRIYFRCQVLQGGSEEGEMMPHEQVGTGENMVVTGRPLAQDGIDHSNILEVPPCHP